MKLLGCTRIYGVRMDDIAKSMTYNINATVRDLYDTLNEEKDNVAIWLESKGGITKADALVKVKSIEKVDFDSDNESIYRFRSLLTGLSDQIIGGDASLYCTGSTQIESVTGIGYISVSSLKSSNLYEIDKFELSNPDIYSIKIDSFSNGSNIFRTNIVINGIPIKI